MAKGDYRNKSFEIEMPDDCDSQEVLKKILCKMSCHKTVLPESADDQSCCEETQEDVCAEQDNVSSEDCLADAMKGPIHDPKAIKKRQKIIRKKRKALQKECQKKAKEIIKDFKLKEKVRRRKEKERVKKIKRYEKEKDKEEKQCRKTRMKCEKNREKVRRAQENEKLRNLKEKMKMKCSSLKYAKTGDCGNEEETEPTKTCLTSMRANNTHDMNPRRQQRTNRCCDK